MTTADLDEAAARLREEAGSLDGFTLEIGSCAIGVETNSEALSERLARYFHYFQRTDRRPDFTITAIESAEPDFGLEFVDWPREGGKTGRKDTFADIPGGRIIRKIRTGMQFLIGERARVAVGPCLKNDNQVINFVNAQYMAWLLDRDWILCHAAAVVHGSGGLAMAGFSGGGKSTLALHLMSAGLDYSSNDRLLVRSDANGMRMSGIPKLPRINPGTALNNPNLREILSPARRKELERMPIEELWDLEEKYDVFIEDCFPGSRFLLEAPMSGFLVLNWKRDDPSETRIRQVSLDERRDLLPALTKSAGPFFAPAGETPAATGPVIDTDSYLECFEGAAVYEIFGKVDFPAAVRMALAVLDDVAL